MVNRRQISSGSKRFEPTTRLDLKELK
jgi:hypothetical protein